MEKKVCSRCKGKGVLSVGNPIKIGSEMGIDYTCIKCYGSGYEVTNTDKYYMVNFAREILNVKK